MHFILKLVSNSFYTEIKFTGRNSSSKLAIASTGDKSFVSKLKASMDDFKNTMEGMTPNISSIIGGKWLFQEDFVPSRTFTPDDYDQSSPLQQWRSQVQLGHQAILQMELDDDVVPTDKLILNAVVRTLLDTSLPSFENGKGEESFTKHNSEGDGFVVVYFWTEGSVVALWNGRNHIDINIFLSEHGTSENVIAAFESNFSSNFSGVKTVLRDDHPRGVGRVVSYWKDVKDGVNPHWAGNIDKKTGTHIPQ